MKPLLLLVPLGAFCIGAVVSDLRLGRIPNFYNACGFACGLSLACASGGVRGLAAGLSGAGLGFALLLVPFLLHMVGGGDLKFMAAAGAIAGPGITLAGFLLGALAGGILALWALARASRSWQGILARFFALQAGFSGIVSSGAKGPTLPYAVPLSVGFIAASVWSLLW